jgi:nucleotide-binding universal stress UspA family protein
MTSTRLQRILCPVDTSEPSAEAARQAIAFARWSGARLTALHVDEPINMADPELLSRLMEERREWMRLQFREAFDAGIDVDLVSGTGVPALEIVTYAAELPADLIVMGTHGVGGFQHLMLGSVAEKVLRRASCPVLTVPPRGVATSRLPFEHILCALDFSDCSLAALEFAMTAALGTGAALTLAHVLDWPWTEPPAPAFDELPPVEAAALIEYRRRRERDALARLGALAPDELRDRCRTRVSHGRAYVELLRLAAEEQADLIVLGVHGRHAVEMAVFGSTTNQVVRRATCPVLTLRH